MDFTHSWKTIYSIGSVHQLPVILQSPKLGPLFFNPLPETLKVLMSSIPFLSPSFIPPPPSVSVPRFIASSTSYNSPVLPSTSAAIGASVSFPLSCRKDVELHNRLEPLKFPGNKVLVFFPTGDNLDRVGCLILKVEDSNLVVDSDFSSSLKFGHQILKLSACPIENWVLGSSGSAITGYLVACSSYAVHWFAVTMKEYDSDSGSGSPALVYKGGKLFRSCSVAHACWNPYMSEECLVLLESGDLFLFNMNSSCAIQTFRCKPWNQVKGWKDNEWFSCEFGSNPRILIVANSNAVYIVDLRFEKCQVRCLVTIELLDMKGVVGEDQFVVFSKVDKDGFYYSVASKHCVLLCDVQRRLSPVVKWAHDVHKPCYMTALPLSVLRSHPCDEQYEGVSDMGFAIILGSFWNNDIGVFCCGLPPPGIFAAELTKFSKLAYAWELPSTLSLSGQTCPCGSCLLKEDFAKEDLPDWILWQQKKELLLGFFVLDKELSSFLPKPGKQGGFTLIRLLSSGKLESQQYCASQKLWAVTREHDETEKYLKDSLLCSMGDHTCSIKKFFFLRPEDLYCHLNNDLAKILFSKSKKALEIESKEKLPDERFIDFMSEKLKSFGCNPPISDLSASDIFRDVTMPTSLFEIAYRVMWIKLPMDILETAFTIYTKVNVTRTDEKKAIMGFPIIPDQEQSPIFFLKPPSRRGNKWSSKVQPSDMFVGPILPLPASLVLYGISKYGYSFKERIDEFSPEKEFSLQCKSIACLAKEMGNVYSIGEEAKEYAVSLMDDNEETWVGSLNPSTIFLYEPSACPDEPSCLDIMEEPEEYERFKLFVAKLPGNESIDKETCVDVMDILDDLSPVELNYNSPIQTHTPEALSEYELLHTGLKTWQESYTPYQDLCTCLKRKQQDVKS